MPSVPELQAHVDNVLGNDVEMLVRQLVRQPADTRGWYALFKACYHLGDVTPALSLALDWIPRTLDVERVFHPIGRLLHVNGLHDAAVAIYEKILSCDPDARQTHSDLLIHKQLCGMDEADAFAELDRWNDRFVKPLLRSSTPAMTPRDPDRPIRIGFVSNDFGGDHSLNSAMAPWFLNKAERHDTYFFYSNRPDDGADHKLFVDAADFFVNISGLSDAAVDRRMREDCIDILVDMVGHMDNSRLLAYARKPSPIIVSWIGIGIPTGVEAVDYFFADDIRVPRVSCGRYKEKVVYFPGTAMAWCPPASAPTVGPVPSVGSGCATFGNLSRVVKIQRETVALWARVLDRVPGSSFLLKDSRIVGQNQRRLSALFGEFGIPLERLIYRTGSSQREHLATYNEIDIVLDCFPQQGGVSSLEALWMGVPVVSYCHPVMPAGRVGRFILENIGLPALAVDAQDAYVDIAAFLARQPEKLSALRGSLRQRMQRSAICNVEAFQRHVDLAFRTIWRRYCNGEPAVSFTVGANA